MFTIRTANATFVRGLTPDRERRAPTIVADTRAHHA
jgi:hypothetical protein